ncbi:hypothetical protein V1264_013640 [Littorina saxatilis]|uniref:Uncharacterized protein n=1 Tax=Littorina saxatilis TaxID=31220 RepID=A0AAN9BQZ9_9CAEN
MTGWYVDAESIPVPRFSPEVRTVLDSREEILPRIWKCMVREAANFYLKKYPDLKSSTLYQQIGYRVFSHYPWIDSYCSGRRPWSKFVKSLSQKVRHTRHKQKALGKNGYDPLEAEAPEEEEEEQE